MDHRESAKVSCIVIFLNAERFMQKAIDSVFAQTVTNWELILVDDGSSDGSSDLAGALAAAHPERVRVLEHEEHQRRGVGASRNLGVEAARGEYVAFLDADDVWVSTQLEEQLAVLKLHPEAAAVFGRTRYWYSWTGQPDDCRRDFDAALSIRFDRVIVPPTLFPHLLSPGDSAFFCICSVLLRREIIERVGRFEPEFVDLYEDMAFHAKVLLVSPVYVSSATWGWYRQHPDSTCAVAERDGNTRDATRHFLGWVAAYLDRSGASTRELRRLVNQRRWWLEHPILDAGRVRIELQLRRLASVRHPNSSFPSH